MLRLRIDGEPHVGLQNRINVGVHGSDADDDIDSVKSSVSAAARPVRHWFLRKSDPKIVVSDQNRSENLLFGIIIQIEESGICV